MIKKIQQCFVLFFLVATMGNALAADASTTQPIKTYTLSDLKQVVSNNDTCDTCLSALQQLTQNPISLQFTKLSDDGKHAVTDLSSQIKNHSHTTVKQTINGNKVTRVATGTFELNDKKIDYVVMMSTDLDNANHQHHYPIILACEDAHCYYTALLKPNDETVKAFQEGVRSGAVAKGTDLHQK